MSGAVLTSGATFKKRRWLWGGLLLVGFWTAVGLVYAGMGYTAGSLLSEVPETFSVTWILLGWYTWIPTSLIALWLVRRFPIERRTWYRAVPVHLVGAVLCSLFACTLYTSMRGVEALFFEIPDFAYGVYLRRVLARSLALDSIMYLTVLVMAHAFVYYQKYRERELRASRLKAQLAAAQLHALQMQLQPHFLFNTFHTISILVRQHRNGEATEMIAALGNVLRYVLDHASEQEVPLEQEARFLEDYVAVEKIRFKERLEVRIDIEPPARRACVPSLLLQPLVENAIRHGIEPGNGPGRVRVEARREGRQLRLRVHDNGAGLAKERSAKKGSGIGLANTRERLERLYGENHHLELSDAPDGPGAMVTIVIPYRTTWRPLERRQPQKMAPAA